MVSGIIVAAGKGRRMGAPYNKVFIKLLNKKIIEYTIRAFVNCKDIDEIILVIGAEDIEKCRKLFKRYHSVKVIAGGETRRASVLNGIEAASGEWVAIHDGARALITPKLISDAVKAGIAYGAATLGVPAKDTVKVINEDGTVKLTPDRTYLYMTQTPQVFEKELIKAAHEASGNLPATDDASLVERLGKPVKMVEGSYTNIKITTPEDLILAKGILKGVVKKVLRVKK